MDKREVDLRGLLAKINSINHKWSCIFPNPMIIPTSTPITDTPTLPLSTSTPLSTFLLLSSPSSPPPTPPSLPPLEYPKAPSSPRTLTINLKTVLARSGTRDPPHVPPTFTGQSLDAARSPLPSGPHIHWRSCRCVDGAFLSPPFGRYGRESP